MRGNIVWSIKEIVEILKQRQRNQFDANMCWSGNRGDGKSTGIGKTFYRFDGFKPWIHQVYSREDVVSLLKKQEKGLCWDDEGINSGYKRDWQNKGQQEMIKILTNYRDNFNVFATAVPNFFSLDKDLRDLYFMHINVIQRGIAVVHMPVQGRMYSQDRWDAKYNAKIEESWSKRIKNNPNFKPQYHKLSTFRGFLYFNAMTPKQEALYKLIKKTKRAREYQDEQPKEIPWLQKVYNNLVEGKLSKYSLQQLCLLEGRKYSSVSTALNTMLTDNGVKETVKAFLLQDDNKSIHNSKEDEINNLVPNL